MNWLWMDFFVYIVLALGLLAGEIFSRIDDGKRWDPPWRTVKFNVWVGVFCLGLFGICTWVLAESVKPEPFPLDQTVIARKP